MERPAPFVRDWPVPDGVARRGAILLVHGLGEHSGRYEHVGARLAALGLEARGYDLAGHGRSGGARGGLAHPEALLDDLQAAFAALADRGGEGAPPFLLGHSMGGAIAARAATGGWVAPRGLILSSPALRLPPIGRAQAALLAIARRLAPGRGFPNRLPIDRISHDPDVVAAYRADGHVHDRISPRLYDFLADAGACARRDAPGLTIPTLLLVAGADRLVDPRGARDFAAALPAGAGTLRWHDDLYHELFNEREPDRERVLAELDAWIEARLTLDSRVS